MGGPSPASTVRIVEEFFCEPLSPNLLMGIAQTPIEQLIMLADQLSFHHEWVARALGVREILGSTRQEAIDRLPTRYRHYVDVHVACSDSLMMEAGREASLLSMDELKRLIIYSSSFIIPDSVFSWAEALMIESTVGYELDESAQGLALASALRKLLPIAPLIRSGYILTVPEAQNFVVGDITDGYLLERALTVATDMTDTAFMRDPVLASTLIHTVNNMEEWEITKLAADGEDIFDIAEMCLDRLENGVPTQDIIDLMRKNLWPNLEHKAIGDLLGFAFITREANTVPVSSKNHVLHYLRRQSALIMPGGQNGVAQSPVTTYSPAISYRVPALINTTLADVVSLRLNEELFSDLRDKLTEVAEEVSKRGAVTGSYDTYISQVRSVSEDIIRPAYDRLEKARRRASVENWLWDKGVGGVVKLGVSGVARLADMSGFVSRPVGSAAGGSLAKLAGKQRRRKQQDLDIAGSIMLSMLEPE